MSSTIEFFRKMPRRKKLTLLLSLIIVITLTILFFVFERPIMRGNMGVHGQNIHNNANNYYYSKHLAKKWIILKYWITDTDTTFLLIKN
jgi:hypothetical protein